MAFRQSDDLKTAAFNFIFEKVCEYGCAIREKEIAIEELDSDITSLELASDLAPKSKRIMRSLYDSERMKAQLVADLEKLRKEYELYYKVFIDDLEIKGEEGIRSSITELTAKEASIKYEIARLSRMKGNEKQIAHLTILHDCYYTNIESAYYFFESQRNIKEKNRSTELKKRMD